MANMMDYLAWRGDVSFKASPFNEVDCLILCQISYLDYGGIVEESFTGRGMTMREAVRRFEASPDYQRRADVGVLINQDSADVLHRAGESARFGGLRPCGFINKIDIKNEEQFSAITFVSDDGWSAVIFRGTDDTIVGWKEDFNLGYMETVPAQADALCYLEEAAARLRGALVVGGHSKGGNLAIYASAYAAPRTQRRLLAVYNNDGPGFAESFFASEGFRAVRNVVHTYVPELSIVGMLFAHADGYVTVESDARGLRQHDPLSWHVMARHFVEVADTNGRSKFIGRTVNEWINALSKEERGQFIEAVFGILKNTDAQTNSQLSASWRDSLGKMFHAAAQMDARTREAVLKTVQLLFKNASQNVGVLTGRL